MSQHHDPVHPDSEHLTPEVLADLDLGLLDEASAAHAESHLAHCAECTDLRGDLAALTAALGSLPVEPMPESVWEQLQQTLSTQPVMTPEGSATVVPIDNARRKRWGRPGIGVVAGAAGVALVGAIVIPTVFGSSSTSSGDNGVMAGADRVPRIPSTAYAATQSGTEYDPKALDQQVTELVAARQTFSPTPVEESVSALDGELTSGTPSPTTDATDKPGATPAPMATSPAAAQACLAGYLNVPDVAPLAIDIGEWQGRPAAVIVLPTDVETEAEVWVIDPDCTGPEDPLFYFATVSR